jgi:hypothetical protein
MGEKRLPTYKGQTLTQTAVRTRVLLTQPLIVTLRTLRPVVTQMVRMNTDLGIEAAVEAWTRGVLTPSLVLAALAVVVAVTARVHRQTDSERPGTAVVSVRARVVHSQLDLGEVTFAVEVDHHRGKHCHVNKLGVVEIRSVGLVHGLIGIVDTVRN